MSAIVANRHTSAHRVIPDLPARMVKADLRKAENVEIPVDIGACLDAARSEARWNLEQLAAALRRDARQVRRWIANEETVQLQVVMTVPELRRPFVIALARQTKCFAIRTVIEELIA